MTSIHPAFLTVDHLGAIVRWERGNTVLQGRLDQVRHRTFDGDQFFVPGASPSCRTATDFKIQGCDLVTVRTDDDRATITIIREAGA